MKRKVLARIDRVCIEIMPINRMLYLTAINSIFDAHTSMWAYKKFYGQKITIAFRLLVDGGLVSASCITGGITDGAMATMAQNQPKKVEQRMAKAVVARIPEMA